MSSDVARSAPAPRRLAAKRRADAQPYEPRRPRRSQRLGELEAEFEDDVLMERPTTTAAAIANSAATSAGGGLFSRLFSYLPIVGKLVAEYDTDARVDEAMPSERSEQDEEDEVGVALGDQLNTNPSNFESKALKGHIEVTATRSPTKRSPPSKPVPTEAEKTVQGTTKNLASARAEVALGKGADKSKMLKITGGESAGADPFAYRITGRRRSKPSSPVVESPLAIIKQKRPISFEQYERLSSQLRSLVAPTPENALALTRSALTSGLDGRSSDGVASDASYRELSVAALPSVKRARQGDDRGITLPVPREDRLTRKPRTSRLLTGAKRDHTSRSAYSAAVADKILSTLNKIQSPLDLETQKPTPSTSLSWAKYHLALVNEQMPDSMTDSAEVEDVPPTSSIPKVEWSPAARSMIQATQPHKDSGKPSFSFPVGSATSNAFDTPVSKPTMNGRTALFTPPVVSMTPAQVTAVPSFATERVEITGVYCFTLPEASNVRSPSSADDESLQYYFSPPPDLREPPRRAPGHQKVGGKAGGAAAFSFMPASPKSRAESLTKSTTVKATPTNVIQPSKAKSSNEVARSGAGYNPLARFLIQDHGSWKCPTCAVTNGVKFSKCACCETEKPGGKSAPKAPESSHLSASSVEGDQVNTTLADIPSKKSFSFGVPNSATAIKPPPPTTCGNFVFGVSASEKSPPGFSFGASATSTAQTARSLTVSSADNASGSTSSLPTSSSSVFSFGESAESKPKNSTSASSKQVIPSLPNVVGLTDEIDTVAAASATPSAGFMFAPSGSGFKLGVNAEPAKTAELTPIGSQKRKSDDVGQPSERNKKQPSVHGSGSATGAFQFSATASSKPGGFSFGGTTSTTTPAKDTTLPSASGFKFAIPQNDAAETIEPTNKSLVFGTQATKISAVSTVPSTGPALGASTELVHPAKSSDSTALFGSTTATFDQPVKLSGSTAGFSFGAAVFDVKASGSGKFGSESVKNSTLKVPPTLDAPTGDHDSLSKPQFAFGGTPSFLDSKSTKAPTNAAPTSKPFTFGLTKSDSVAENGAGKTFAFGQKSGSSSSEGQPASSQAPFTFGASEVAASAPSSFTSSSSTSTFAFGGAAGSEQGAKPSASFTFGAPTQSAAPPFVSAPSNQSAAPTAFSSASASLSPVSPAFGSAATTFGQAASSGFTSSSSFGGSSSGFSSNPSTSFGSSAALTPSFGSTPSNNSSSTPAFSYGAVSQAPASAQAPFAFGATTTSSSAFSTPSANAFGNSMTTPSTFGASNGGFGAPGSVGAFNSNPPATPFGATPAPSFGATPAPSPAFASTPGTGFGAGPSPSFGASPATAFGAPVFGASNPGFGTPSPAPTPVFGAGPSTPFGGQGPFGAPGSGFGGPPPTPGFGGAPDGGFSMGAAPQAPKGRRILKARSRASGSSAKRS